MWQICDRVSSVDVNSGWIGSRVHEFRSDVDERAERTEPIINDGDEILLIAAAGVPVSRAVYNAAQVRSSEWIEFGGRKVTNERIFITDIRTFPWPGFCLFGDLPQISLAICPHSPKTLRPFGRLCFLGFSNHRTKANKDADVQAKDR